MLEPIPNRTNTGSMPSIKHENGSGHDNTFATLSSADQTNSLSKSQRRLMTKNDVFASTAYSKDGYYNQPTISEASTAAGHSSNFKKDESFLGSNSRGSEFNSSLHVSQFNGTFDENIGVVTSKLYKEMKKNGRSDIDLEEQARQYTA